MRNPLTTACLASLAASAVLAIGSIIVLDTTQPMARLTRVEAWQGASLTVLATVRQSGQPYTNAITVTLAWGTNTVTAPATNGIAILDTPSLADTGLVTYTMTCADGAQTNALGDGFLHITPATILGGTP